jgi:hypothetical protein
VIWAKKAMVLGRRNCRIIDGRFGRVFMQSFIVVTGETVVELGTAWKSCPSQSPSREVELMLCSCSPPRSFFSLSHEHITSLVRCRPLHPFSCVQPLRLSACSSWAVFNRREIAASALESTLERSWLVRDLSDLSGDAAGDVESERGDSVVVVALTAR